MEGTSVYCLGKSIIHGKGELTHTIQIVHLLSTSLKKMGEKSRMYLNIEKRLPDIFEILFWIFKETKS